MELVAGLRCAIETEERSGHSGGHLLDAPSALIEERFHATEARSGQYDVALTERSVAHEDCGSVAAALVEGGFDNRTHGVAVRVGLEFKHIGFEEYFLEQFLNADALLGTDVLTLVLTAPFFHEEVHRCQAFLDLIGVCSRLVDFVDGENDRHIGRHSVVDGLFRLRHDVVIGCNDDDSNVGDLCTAGTHGRKGFVTRRIQEGDVSAAIERHVVGSDVLRDTTRLTGNNVGVADVVEQ